LEGDYIFGSIVKPMLDLRKSLAKESTLRRPWSYC